VARQAPPGARPNRDRAGLRPQASSRPMRSGLAARAVPRGAAQRNGRHRALWPGTESGLQAIRARLMGRRPTGGDSRASSPPEAVSLPLGPENRPLVTTLEIIDLGSRSRRLRYMLWGGVAPAQLLPEFPAPIRPSEFPARRFRAIQWLDPTKFRCFPCPPMLHHNPRRAADSIEGHQDPDGGTGRFHTGPRPFPTRRRPDADRPSSKQTRNRAPWDQNGGSCPRQHGPPFA
jgi:hypothetical protein